MRKLFPVFLSVFLTFCLAGIAYATNGYQLIGVGQIQKSMGGAVTAAPVDPMTAITNPAGMARIGKRADFSMEAFMPTRSVDFSATGGGSTEGGSELYGIPSLGWVAPAFNSDNVFFGGGMYATSGLGVDYDEVLFSPGNPLAPAGLGGSDVTFSGFSAIQFWKMAPTIAWNVNDDFSLGFALNLDYQSVTIREKIRNVPFIDSTSPTGFTQRDVNFDLGRPTSQLGFGATFGALYDIGDVVTVGFNYASKQFFGDSEYRVGEGDIQNFNGATGKAGTYKMDLDYPQQAALGIAVKPVKPLTVSFDVKWINWHDTHDRVTFEGPTNDSFMTATGPQKSTELEFGWEDQWVYALGIQYAVNDDFTVRTGYNYSKSPIDEADVFNNLVFPAIVEQHFALGFDYMLGDHWGIGLTYMKAFKETLKGKNDVPAGFQQATAFQTSDSGSKITLEEDSVGMQLVYLF